MRTAGILAEYNPFHTGHGRHLAQTRAALGGDCAIVCVMSGNWVQRADCALVDKWVRAELALRGGADLVLELPTPWATASAEGFARAGVALLCATGVVETLSFGSECGEVDALARVAGALDSPAWRAGLRRWLDRGLPFAAARQRAAEELPGVRAELLSGPNNSLGVEYLRALRALESDIRPMTVRREGAGHNASAPPGAPFVPASCLRQWLRAGDWAAAEPYLPPGGAELLRSAPLAELGRAERAILARVRSMTEEDWAALPDAAPAEGLPRRLARAGGQAASLEEFFALAKTKRYSHARLRRLTLAAWLGISRRERQGQPACLRVLGMNERGQALLREMKGRARLPIVTKPAHARALGEEAGRQLALEARFTDLYDLCLPQVPPGGREWRTGPARPEA